MAKDTSGLFLRDLKNGFASIAIELAVVMALLATAGLVTLVISLLR